MTEWQDAIAYCTRKHDGVVGILEVVATSSDGSPHSVTANPVLVELADRSPSGGARAPTQLHDRVWRAIVDHIAENADDYLAIAASAEWRGRPDLADSLLLRAAEKGTGTASQLATRVLREPDRQDEPPEVTGLLERASSGPEPVARRRRFAKAVRSKAVDDAGGSARRRQVGIAETPVDAASRTFDPTLTDWTRWQALYDRQALRDTARFCVLLICDVTAVGAGILAAQNLGSVALNRPGTEDLSSSTIAVEAAVLVLGFFLLFGLYRSDRERAHLGEILKGTALAGVSLSLLAVGNGYSLTNLPLAGVAVAGASALAFWLRWLYDQRSRRWVRDHKLQSRALLVASAHPTATAESIRRTCRRPTQFVGYVAPEAAAEAGWLGTLDDLEVIGVWLSWRDRDRQAACGISRLA